MCRDAEFAHRLADLEVYVRQHHAEADLERLGGHVLDGTAILAAAGAEGPLGAGCA
jgi:heme oxygenase